MHCLLYIIYFWGLLMKSLRIMSNNIWCRGDNSPLWAKNGENCSAEHRAVGFVRVYSEVKPDIIGLQECTARLADNIMRMLTGKKMPYALLWGRDTPIIYRKDRLELIDSEFSVYPQELPGYAGTFNNGMTKSYCIGVFKDKDSGESFIFGTTHLWWKSSDEMAPPEEYQPHSDEARVYQMGLFTDCVEAFREKYGCSAVLVGDLNAVYSSKAVSNTLARGYEHAYDIAAEHRDETCGIHYCYEDGFDMYEKKQTFCESIDHILVSGDLQKRIKSFERYYPNYYMPLSDHFPVWIDVY